MTLSKPKNPDDSGPTKAHDFSVRVNGLLAVQAFVDGRKLPATGPAERLCERDAWFVFLTCRTQGKVELLRGPVVVARIGARSL